MTADEVVHRLRAFERGHPLPSGETLRVPRIEPSRILILAFVRMGGESAPWGLAFGAPGATPTVLTVAEARTRDAVAAMMLQFANALLTHVHQPRHSACGPDPEAVVPPFQVWLPNESHLEMLHHLAYTYTFTKFGEPTRWQKLRTLGRACGWLFREAQRPGQMVVMPASRVLTDAYTFPAETTRQGHLGFLLEWLLAKGGADERTAAAAAAERLSVSTNLDPAMERDELEPFVRMFNEARQSGDESAQQRASRRIHKLLTDELQRRFTLSEAAIQAIRSDSRRENAALSKLVAESMSEHRYQYRRAEQRHEDAEDGVAFTPSPETDRHPAAGASRYFVHEASQELLESLMAHDDKELQARLVATGQGIAGAITDVRDEGVGRRTVPVWTVDTRGRLPLRLREDSELCVVGLPSRKLRVRAVKERAAEGYSIELVVTSLVTVPRNGDGTVLPAASPALKGTSVVLLKPSMDQVARRKSMRVWKRDAPGAWLTHSVPDAPASRLPRGVAEDLAKDGSDIL